MKFFQLMLRHDLHQDHQWLVLSHVVICYVELFYSILTNVEPHLSTYSLVFCILSIIHTILLLYNTTAKAIYKVEFIWLCISRRLEYMRVEKPDRKMQAECLKQQAECSHHEMQALSIDSDLEVGEVLLILLLILFLFSKPSSRDVLPNEVCNT